MSSAKRFALLITSLVVCSNFLPCAEAEQATPPVENAASAGSEKPAAEKPATPNASDDDGSLATTFQALEEKAGLVPNPNDSFSKRLAGLELKIFGEIQTGSLMERINFLKAKIEADKLVPSEKARIEKNDEKQDEKPVEKAVSADPIKRHISQLTAELPPINTNAVNFFRVEPVDTVKDTDYLKDILQATEKKVLRFKVMPIPVYITPYQVRSYSRACVEGFENWEERTSGRVRFVQVDNPAQARIKVVWNRLGMSTDADNCALGAHTVTKWTKHPSGKMAVVAVGTIPLPVYIPRLGPKYTVPAQVVEVNLDLIDNKAPDYRYTLLKNIVTHELGHALGLLGHSQEKSDMMYAVTDENSRISKRDINTLTRLYELKADIPL